MIKLALLRHGATDWNAAKRLQGRTDIPLSAAGRAALADRRPPPSLDQAVWYASPLGRAVETARLLGREPVVDPALIEMDWGAWEGRTVAALRAELGPAMTANEARGLDLQPPGGETPRLVRDRLRPWLAARAAAGRDVAAVTHKGVIRALLTLAYGWDLTGKPPVKLDWSAVHVFRLDDDGGLRPIAVNLPLAPR
jgi:probable phosphoglycerate mutase